MLIRSYRPSDRENCLRILASNTPRFFAASELAEFKAFLDRLPGPYFVVEREGVVVACGGWYAVEGSTEVRLTWGMVEEPHQLSGLGRDLLRFRLEDVRARGASVVTLGTSQLTAGFFEREGFRVARRVPEGYSKGLDRLEMELRFEDAG